tara:strand:+ start:243 stop:458 length:216 start_codon:yes stop_codon:yes gene_type:complete
MLVKIQSVLYNLDYIISVDPVKNYGVEGTTKDYDYWYFSILFSDGALKDISYKDYEEALTDYSKIERNCIK